MRKKNSKTIESKEVRKREKEPEENNKKVKN